MFYILLSTIIIFPVLIGIGELFQKIFGKIWEGISAKILSGIFLLAMIWQVLAFFIPIDIWVESVSLIVGIVGFFYFKSYEDIYKIEKNKLLKISVISLLIIFAAGYYPFILDHFGYYVPSIDWLQHFGFTKGLANLSLIYAQMSTWHVFQTGFSNFADEFLRINAVFLIAYIIYIFEKKAWNLLLISPIFLFFVQSPSPDLPAFAFSLILLNEVLMGNKKSGLLLAFSVLIFTIKPTMIWLPIFVFLKFFDFKNFKFLYFGILVLAIYFFKNIWLFGYPFFPVQIGNFGFSWLPNSDVLQRSSEVAILKTYDAQYSLDQIKNFTTKDYIVNWFTLKSYKKLIHFAFILSLIFMTIFTFVKKEKTLFFLWISIVLKSIFVVYFSAQFRFFLDVFFVIFLVVFFDKFKEKFSLASFFLGSFLILILLSFPKILQTQIKTFKLGHYMQGFTKKQFYEPAHFELNNYKSYKIGNLDFNIPNYYLSFDTPQPALSPSTIKQYYEAGIFPQKMGKNIKDGFVWKKLSEKEKLKLKEIVSKFEK